MNAVIGDGSDPSRRRDVSGLDAFTSGLLESFATVWGLFHLVVGTVALAVIVFRRHRGSMVVIGPRSPEWGQPYAS